MLSRDVIFSIHLEEYLRDITFSHNSKSNIHKHIKPIAFFNQYFNQSTKNKKCYINDTFLSSCRATLHAYSLLHLILAISSSLNLLLAIGPGSQHCTSSLGLTFFTGITKTSCPLASLLIRPPARKTTCLESFSQT